MDSAELRRAFTSFFAGARAHARALGEPDPAPPDGADVHELGDDAVRPVLPRRGAGALRPAAGRHDPEVRAGRRQAQRPRRDRPHPPPPQLLRDARQLQLRRLLQARGHPVGVGVRSPRCSASTATASGSPSTSPTTRPRRSGRRGRLPARAHPAARQGQLLGDGRHRPVRPVLGDLLRLRPRARARTAARPTRRPRTATSRSGTSCSCSTSAAPTARSADLPQPEHRHRRRPRAHADASSHGQPAPCATPTSLQPPASTPRSRSPAGASATDDADRRRAAASSPTTPAR